MMKVHQYFYGPVKSGIDFAASPELTKVVTEDIIRDLYCQKGSKIKRTDFSNIYTISKELVIGVTRIEPVQAPTDGRASTINRSVFIRVSEIVEALGQLLDAPQSFPVKTLNVQLKQT